MALCEVAIGVDRHVGTENECTEWHCMEFRFDFLPRVGETIWIGDHESLLVTKVEHGFLDDGGPPKVRIESDMSWDCFQRSRSFLKAWGFSGC